MLMQGETLSYTPNFSTPPFLDSHGLPRFYDAEYNENNWWVNKFQTERV